MIKAAAAVVLRQRAARFATATTTMRIGSIRTTSSVSCIANPLFSNSLLNNAVLLQQHIGRTFSTRASDLADLASFGIGVPNEFIRPSVRIPQLRSRRRRLPSRYGRSAVAAEKTKLQSKIIPVSAIHVAQTIDIYAVLSKVFAGNAIRKQMFGKNSFVVELVPNTPEDAPRYVALFRFGSIVFFNVTPREIASLVTDIKKHSFEPVLSGLERREKFGVLVSDILGGMATPATILVPPEEEAPVVTGDYCIVEELDFNGVAVIGNIMAQTVALDSYNDTVDNLLANFARINSTVTKTGSFSSTDKNFLFKTVAQNNSIFIDMISKIRIKDRSDTAWNLTKYEKIHYGMKDEFEIDDRFEHIEFKLNLIQQNAKFFLEVLQHQKTNSLEWIIVILITLECGLMCVDMSGMGDSMFGAISSLISSLTGGRS